MGDLSGLSLMMMFYSYYYFDEYWDFAREYAYVNQAPGTYSCSAVFFVSAGTHDSIDQGDGHGFSCSSYSSSCSSCGRRCSS